MPNKKTKDEEELDPDAVDVAADVTDTEEESEWEDSVGDQDEAEDF
jgi:hypothetical protein